MPDPQQLDDAKLAASLGLSGPPKTNAPALPSSSGGLDDAALARALGMTDAPPGGGGGTERMFRNVLTRITDPLMAEELIGAGKSIGTTIHRGGNMIRRIPGVGPALSLADQPAFDEEGMKPSNGLQEYGGFVGDAALGAAVAGPVAGGARAAGLRLIPRIIINGATNAAVGSAQGGDPSTSGAIGALLPEVGPAIVNGSSRVLARVGKTTPDIARQWIDANAGNLTKSGTERMSEAAAKSPGPLRVIETSPGRARSVAERTVTSPILDESGKPMTRIERTVTPEKAPTYEVRQAPSPLRNAVTAHAAAVAEPAEPLYKREGTLGYILYHLLDKTAAKAGTGLAMMTRPLPASIAANAAGQVGLHLTTPANGGAAAGFTNAARLAILKALGLDNTPAPSPGS